MTNYNADTYYVFSEDVNMDAVLTTANKGSILYKETDDTTKLLTLPPNTMLFLQDTKQIKSIGKDKWIGVILYNAYNYEDPLVKGFIKGNQIKKMLY